MYNNNKVKTMTLSLLLMLNNDNIIIVDGEQCKGMLLAIAFVILIWGLDIPNYSLLQNPSLTFVSVSRKC